MEKYISKISKNAAPVTIAKDAGAFLVMSDGMQVKKEALEQNYTLITESAIITEQELPKNSVSNSIFNQIKNFDMSNFRENTNVGKVLDTTDQTSINPQIITGANNNIQVPDVSQYKVYENDDDVPVETLGATPVQNTPTSKKPILNENGLTEQQEYYRQEQITLTGIDPYLDVVNKYKEMKSNKNTNSPIVNVITEDDKSFDSLKKMKNIHDIKLKIFLNEKIADPNFIKMMTMNMDVDIIKYYTKTILKKYLSDVSILENAIYNQLSEIVFGKSKKDVKTKKKKKSVKKQAVKKEIEEKII